MLKVKYNLGQEVYIVFEGKLRKAEVICIKKVGNKVEYEVKVIVTFNNGYFKLTRTEYIWVEENEIKKPKNMAPTNKVYSGEEGEKIIKKIFGMEGVPNVRFLKIEIIDHKVIAHYTFKGEFNPKKIVSKCHPDDTFSEEKGIMACVIKCNIEALKNHLNNL